MCDHYFSLGYFLLGKRGRMAEVKIMLREGLGIVYTSPSISGVGKVKAGELFRKREEFPLAKLPNLE